MKKEKWELTKVIEKAIEEGIETIGERLNQQGCYTIKNKEKNTYYIKVNDSIEIKITQKEV